MPIAPTVSIGLPVFNGASFLSEALDSLLAQTFTDFELIISDNCSNDSTSLILQYYAEKDGRIKVFRQQSNIGAFKNFVFVLNQANSPYFMWAACDDVWDSDWLSELLPFVQSSDCFAFANLSLIGQASKPITHLPYTLKLATSTPPTLRRLIYYQNNPLAGKACLVYSLFRTQTLKRLPIDLIDTGKFGADMLFIYEALKSVPSVSLASGPRIYKRVHNASLGASHISVPSNISILSFAAPLVPKVFALIEPILTSILYLSYSKPIEQIFILLLTPFVFTRNLICLLFRFLKSRL